MCNICDRLALVTRPLITVFKLAMWQVDKKVKGTLNCDLSPRPSWLLSTFLVHSIFLIRATWPDPSPLIVDTLEEGNRMSYRFTIKGMSLCAKNLLWGGGHFALFQTVPSLPILFFVRCTWQRCDRGENWGTFITADRMGIYIRLCCLILIGREDFVSSELRLSSLSGDVFLSLLSIFPS